ncbi:GGDEF domain-containing protein [Rhizobium terrae]|uniref:GGDEF domain-containing protein n=1 Tax=Rhizobium terrae TaxID=2171756 RepID=UPI000E3E6DCE|nr:GGDEF domain-containing protein [Rhizobium terrae]
MPYLQSQHFRDTERLAYGWAAPSPVQMEAANLTADPLTGFPNLKEFYRLGPPMIAECLTEETPCAVAIIDIDHFRRLNDSHSEEMVGRVLKAIAGKLSAACAGRRHLLARLGDEEFGLMVVGLDGASATALCEKLRLEIAAMRMEGGNTDFSITVSIGLADVYGPENFDNYLNAAEQFLFMAKNYGRNQVFSDHTIVLQAAD